MNAIFIGKVGTAVDSGVYRILVDRLWPRGIAKIAAPWDAWMKDVAPSTPLRQWYGHEELRYEEFRHRYWEELLKLRDGGAMNTLRERWQRQPLILLTVSKLVEISQVPVLRDFLETEYRSEDYSGRL